MTMSSLRDGASISPEVRSFFRAIKENPDDDTPRLIFADWLQERGDTASAARGEYLRLAVRRHRLASDDPIHELLKRREAELFTEHRWSWLGPLTDAARGWTFERGMVQITAAADKLLTPEVADWARTEAALWIDSLTLTDLESTHCKPLIPFPLLAYLNTLDISDNLSLPYFFRNLFRKLNADHFPFLTCLLLSGNRLTATELISLLCTRLPRLRILDLQQNRLNDGCARTLVEAPLLANGVLLRLGHNRFTATGIELLRRALDDRVQF